jgi:hypothetical protein
VKTFVTWLDSAQAAQHIGLVDADGNPKLAAFHVWVWRARKRGLKVHRLGRRLRFREVDLDRCVEAEPDALPESKSLRVLRGGR